MAEKKKIFNESDFDKDKQLFTFEDFEKEKDVPTGADTKGSDPRTSDPDTRPSKGLGKAIGGIIGIAAVCLLGYGAYSYMNQPDNESITPETAITDGGATDGGATGGGATGGGATGGGATDGDATDGDAAKSTEPAKATNQSTKTVQPTIPVVQPATHSGTLEEKAKEVIRGKYGNGEIRKQKLGDQYSEIQSKVNEMYRNGLVK